MDNNLAIIIDKAAVLLHDCRFSSKGSREKAEEAMNLLRPYKDIDIGKRLYLGSRGLVSYPDLLEEYLSSFEIEGDDYAVMLARCVEYKINVESWNHDSLLILLKYRDKYNVKNIRILPGKYKIDERLYSILRDHEIRDIYYDGTIDSEGNKYMYDSPRETDGKEMYYGFRYAYHLLLYGGSRRKELVEWWENIVVDCTFDAAKEYYKLEKIDDIKAAILKTSI